jgi:hypothetical protein
VNSKMLKFIDKLMKSPSGMIICNTLPNDVGQLENELGRRKIPLIWLDAHIPITDYYKLVVAFNIAFHYNKRVYSLDTVADYLFDAWYLPYRACVIYLSETELLRKDEHIYKSFKEDLESLSHRWQMRGYTFRSVLIEKKKRYDK